MFLAGTLLFMLVLLWCFRLIQFIFYVSCEYEVLFLFPIVKGIGELISFLKYTKETTYNLRCWSNHIFSVIVYLVRSECCGLAVANRTPSTGRSTFALPVGVSVRTLQAMEISNGTHRDRRWTVNIFWDNSVAIVLSYCQHVSHSINDFLP
jgi:hypothetical protein